LSLLSAGGVQEEVRSWEVTCRYNTYMSQAALLLLGLLNALDVGGEESPLQDFTYGEQTLFRFSSPPSPPPFSGHVPELTSSLEAADVLRVHDGICSMGQRGLWLDGQ